MVATFKELMSVPLAWNKHGRTLDILVFKGQDYCVRVRQYRDAGGALLSSKLPILQIYIHIYIAHF